MPNVSVIQLSDLHFGASGQNAHPSGELADQVAEVAASLNNPLILASGDITFKAADAGYREASQFFDRVRNATGLGRDRFLFCPGNHDCHAQHKFKAFDAFTFGVRQDGACTFSARACQVVDVDGLTFVLLNSAYHFDHEFGLVDLDSLRRIKIAEPADCVAVSHHHVIPSDPNDPSTTRNAYGLLTALDDMHIPVLLHGHQHVTKAIPVGNTPVQVIGVNSFNFAYAGGQNALGVLEWTDKSVKFERRIYLSDGVGSAGRRFETLDGVTIR
jgi:3',5'-cyclic AMP phosphodiesterase CpdA